MSLRHTYPGACHCRNIELRLESDRTPAELGSRADACSFCSKHHALYTSDPHGEMHVSVRERSLVDRYRFGTRTADFLLCKACGVFVAATMPEPPLAVVNVNVLDARSAFLANPVQVADFDGESLEQRLARRRARWTPLPSFGAPGTAIPTGTELARPFLPTRDFDTAKRFYEALGFEILLDGVVAVFRAGGGGFILQRFFHDELAQNLVMQLMVDDLDAWWGHVAGLDLVARFGVKPPRPPEMQPWGLRVAFLFDPSGVLWHIAQRRPGVPQD